MIWSDIHAFLVIIQHCVSVIGILIILSGVLQSLYQYLFYFFSANEAEQIAKINTIRGGLGRTLILGLEFIVAADLIGSTTTPDYYSVGLLAIIVVIRTFLSYSLSREMLTIQQGA